jgi:predicted DsbA family dithiol-disulfide isomerase
MNVALRPPSRLAAELVFDLVCPWCLIGLRRLDRALARRPDVRLELAFRPFLLNPEMPRGGLPRPEYLLRKYGGEERARRLHAAIAEVGRAEGIAFRFDLITRTPASLDAHRLVRFATRHGVAREVVDALFAAYFTEGRDIGEVATLAEIGAASGLPMREARAFLGGQEEVETISAENLRAHRLGINGVPCLMLAGRHAISGAQESEVISRLFDVAVLEAGRPG